MWAVSLLILVLPLPLVAWDVALCLGERRRRRVLARLAALGERAVSDPDWFRPGVLVRLKPTVSLDGYPQTAVLAPAPPSYASDGFLYYPAEVGAGCYVRPEHVEPVEAPARKVNFRELFP